VNRQRRCLLTLAPASVVLGGCGTFVAAPQSAALLQATPSGLPHQALLRDVAFFAQTPYHCGPAALAMVLVHAGFKTTPDALADAVFLPSRQGALQDEMLAATRRIGALAVPLPAALAALCEEVAAGHPVVVLQNLGLAFAPRWHYAVVVGFDLREQHLVLHSGANAYEVMGLPLFERTWARGGWWSFVALAPTQLPRTASESAAVTAALAFERVAPTQQAATAYQTVLQRWPHNLLAALGLGNALAALNDLDGAARAFEAAAQRHDSAAAWHNLGVIKLRLGDKPAAARAAARAVVRAQASDPSWLARAQQLANAAAR
jgi:tetratricopeptide (TPR) repeat protein